MNEADMIEMIKDDIERAKACDNDALVDDLLDELQQVKEGNYETFGC